MNDEDEKKLIIILENVVNEIKTNDYIPVALFSIAAVFLSFLNSFSETVITSVSENMRMHYFSVYFNGIAAVFFFAICAVLYIIWVLNEHNEKKMKRYEKITACLHDLLIMHIENQSKKKLYDEKKDK